MRPLVLELVGFSAFRERAEVRFDGADLVAFVGATGSGKSSLIDAMTFALYGSVSRYADSRLVEPVIHKLATEARVRLDFELEGVRYVAVRVVRRTKASATNRHSNSNKHGATTKEARLVRMGADDGPDGAILAGSAPEMTRAVQRLLGLDFDQFTRTVVLPQGEFATFLHEDKGKRQQLLRQLLDVGQYERMGQLARQRSSEAEVQGRTLAEQRDRHPEVTDAQLAELDARAAGLAALGDVVRDHLARIGTLGAERAGAQAELADLVAQRTALRDLELPGEVASLGVELAAAVEALEAATSALASARDARDEAQQAVEAGADVALVERTLDQLAQRSRLEASIAALEPRVAAAEAARATATTEEVTTRAALDEATERLATAKDAAGAEALVAALVAGQPCPVCRQVVAELPDHDLGQELAAASSAHRAARAAHDAAATARQAAEREHTRLEVERRTGADGLALLVSTLTGADDEPTLRAALADAADRKARSQAAAAAAGRAEQEVAGAQAAVDRLRGTERDLRLAYTAARASVAARRPPAPDGSSLHDDWKALVAWAAAEAGPVQAALAEAQQAEARAGVALDAELAAVGAACAPYAVDPDPQGLGERVATAATTAVHARDDARRVQHERAELTAQIAVLDEERVVTGAMGRHLSVAGFERWLLQEALDDLVARATERLFELSSGQFSLGTDDGDFWIRDHRNADERRDVRTLSGGETFLAALALALALADNVAELAVDGGPRLESMFLDEGFGTLDPETLDVVATAMEELSASGRLIGIVTHIRELADRMPVRFEVRRDATSAHVSVVEA